MGLASVAEEVGGLERDKGKCKFSKRKLCSGCSPFDDGKSGKFCELFILTQEGTKGLFKLTLEESRTVSAPRGMGNVCVGPGDRVHPQGMRAIYVDLISVCFPLPHPPAHFIGNTPCLGQL